MAKNKQQLLTVIRVVFIFLLIYFFVKIVWKIAPEWSGFGDKTFWDLVELLFVPILLGALAIWFSHQSNTNSMKLVKEQLEDNSLQKYFDAIFELISENNLLSTDEDNELTKTIAWQRTITITQILNENRKKILLDYLYYSNMIFSKNNIINLNNSNFSNIIYSNGYLSNVYLRGVNFENSDFTNTRLREADLHESNLKKCIFDNCDLVGANLVGANLSHASFKNAELNLANFFKAMVSDEQLREAKSLLGAIMKDGNIYDGRYLLPADLDCALGFGVNLEDQKEIENWSKNARELISDHMDIDLKISNKYDYL